MSFNVHKRTRIAVDLQDRDENGEIIMLTEQHHKDELDVKSIVRGIQKGVYSKHLKEFEGKYIDLPGSVDFLEAKNTITRAKEMWATVPSNVRAHFQNDPGRYVDFMSNPDNYDEIKKLGINPDYIPKEFRPKPPHEPAKEPPKKPEAE
jgi:phage internal scaffolding protein